MGPIDGLEKLVCLWDPKRVSPLPSRGSEGSHLSLSTQKRPCSKWLERLVSDTRNEKKKNIFYFHSKKREKGDLEKSMGKGGSEGKEVVHSIAGPLLPAKMRAPLFTS
jgi:hypothetical protein